MSKLEAGESGGAVDILTANKSRYRYCYYDYYDYYCALVLVYTTTYVFFCGCPEMFYLPRLHEVFAKQTHAEHTRYGAVNLLFLTVRAYIRSLSLSLCLQCYRQAHTLPKITILASYIFYYYILYVLSVYNKLLLGVRLGQLISR